MVHFIGVDPRKPIAGQQAFPRMLFQTYPRIPSENSTSQLANWVILRRLTDTLRTSSQVGINAPSIEHDDLIELFTKASQTEFDNIFFISNNENGNDLHKSPDTSIGCSAGHVRAAATSLFWTANMF